MDARREHVVSRAELCTCRRNAATLCRIRGGPPTQSANHVNISQGNTASRDVQDASRGARCDAHRGGGLGAAQDDLSSAAQPPDDALDSPFRGVQAALISPSGRLPRSRYSRYQPESRRPLICLSFSALLRYSPRSIGACRHRRRALRFRVRRWCRIRSGENDARASDLGSSWPSPAVPDARIAERSGLLDGTSVNRHRSADGHRRRSGTREQPRASAPADQVGRRRERAHRGRFHRIALRGLRLRRRDRQGPARRGRQPERSEQLRHDPAAAGRRYRRRADDRRRCSRRRRHREGRNATARRR